MLTKSQKTLIDIIQLAPPREEKGSGLLTIVYDEYAGMQGAWYLVPIWPENVSPFKNERSYIFIPEDNTQIKSLKKLPIFTKTKLQTRLEPEN